MGEIDNNEEWTVQVPRYELAEKNLVKSMVMTVSVGARVFLRRKPGHGLWTMDRGRGRPGFSQEKTRAWAMDYGLCPWAPGFSQEKNPGAHAHAHAHGPRPRPWSIVHARVFSITLVLCCKRSLKSKLIW